MLLFVGMGKRVLNCCFLLSNELLSCMGLVVSSCPGEDLGHRTGVA